MTTALSTPEWVRESGADRALRASAIAWYVVEIIGQWAFIYFIVSFYGSSTIEGHFEAWNRRNLIKGYVAGDGVGNLFFAAHVLVAALITASGGLQLVPKIRARARLFHHWNGRVYLATAAFMALGGLWLIWVRGTYTTIYGALSTTLLAALILISAAMTLRYALARRIDRHHRWALRLFMVVNGVWFQRLGYMAWILANRGPVGIGKNLDGPFDLVWGFGCYLLPLAILELYLRAQAGAGTGGKYAMSLTLVASTLVTGAGIVGAYLIMWKPYL